MASIRRKGRAFQVVSSVYADGRRVQRCRTFATMAAARAYRAQIEPLEKRGVGSVRITLSGYLPNWAAEKAQTVEPNTLAGYERWIEHVQRCPIASMALDRIMPRDLEQTYQYLLDTPAARGKPLSPSSVHHVHRLLRNALTDAVRHQLIVSNPAIYARTVRGAAKKVAIPTEERCSMTCSGTIPIRSTWRW